MLHPRNVPRCFASAAAGPRARACDAERRPTAVCRSAYASRDAISAHSRASSCQPRRTMIRPIARARRQLQQLDALSWCRHGAGTRQDGPKAALTARHPSSQVEGFCAAQTAFCVIRRQPPSPASDAWGTGGRQFESGHADQCLPANQHLPSPLPLPHRPNSHAISHEPPDFPPKMASATSSVASR